MFEVLRSTTSNSSYEVIDVEDDSNKRKMFQDYVLTMDNFFKMCLIIMREKCEIPCVIEGESGVGKTALIRFLAENIYKTRL